MPKLNPPPKKKDDDNIEEEPVEETQEPEGEAENDAEQ